ncbi:protein Tob1-like isoform X2 [Cylas formicarius]|uniref:protein Tob1-like isoform X2 n=1 Tax=Cylas formicarius TaxID=197179 RepID=UPI002958BA06|nr:protein Tob1-like isoform X2 [Cylas formicarius]
MHIEVQVALNFVISYLYNKLPRRRVNIFGEELEKALKDKFQGHWYPDKPFKGSAFRCLKTGDPIDKVLERAARESGVPIQDILENLPQELAVWVDPGEVSYRIGEKGAVKILFSDKIDPQEDHSADRELQANAVQQNGNQPIPNNQHMPSPSSAPSPTSMGNSFKGSPSPVPAFIPRTTTPLTFTTATFAQTKFGSTKLKTSSKRANRMSPTEFSNYIKQRAMQQQLHQQPPHHSPGGRALSPDPSAFYFPPHGHYPPQFPPRSVFESSNQFLSPDLYPTGKLPFEPSPLGPYYPNNGGVSVTPSTPNTPQDNGKLMDNNWPYAASGQYQHLLVAN